MIFFHVTYNYILNIPKNLQNKKDFFLNCILLFSFDSNGIKYNIMNYCLIIALFASHKLLIHEGKNGLAGQA